MLVLIPRPEEWLFQTVVLKLVIKVIQLFILEAITVIKQNDEILWSYGAQYIYPPEYPTNFEL